jgi:hypothetical protein
MESHKIPWFQTTNQHMNGNSISIHTILSQYIRHIGAMSAASRSTTTQNVLPWCCGHLLAKDHGITDPIWNRRNKPTLLVIGKLYLMDLYDSI